MSPDREILTEVEREVGRPVERAEVVYDRGGVSVLVAATPDGPVVGVRSPHGRALVGPGRAPPPRPSLSLDELHFLASYRAELDALDIRVPAALASSDPHVLARATGAPVAIVKRWQAAAELLVLREVPAREATSLALVGVDGVTDLARRSPPALVEELNRHLAVDRPAHAPYDEQVVSRWVQAARTLLRDARGVV